MNTYFLTNIVYDFGNYEPVDNLPGTIIIGKDHLTELLENYGEDWDKDFYKTEWEFIYDLLMGEFGPEVGADIIADHTDWCCESFQVGCIGPGTYVQQVPDLA